MVRYADGLARRVRGVSVPLPLARASFASLAASPVARGLANQLPGALNAFTRDNPFTSDRARRELGWSPTIAPGRDPRCLRVVAGRARTVSETERTALKEWAVLVDAMERGDIIAMVRKGGIRERRAGFDVRHDRFLLYPTFFHEKIAELAERFRPSLECVHANRPPEGTIEMRSWRPSPRYGA